MAEGRKRTVWERCEFLDAQEPLGTEKFVDAIRKASGDRSPSMRWRAFWHTERNAFEELLPLAELALSDKDDMVRAMAAVCVGTLLEGSGVAHRPLRKLLKDCSWVVRDDAQESLGAICNKGALPQIELLIHDEHPVARSHCAPILARLGGKRYKKSLKQHLAMETDEHPQAGMLAGLILLGEQVLLPKLLAHLQSERYVVRCATANYLRLFDFTASERRQVFKALRFAEKNPIARADQSAMQTALKFLKASR